MGVAAPERCQSARRGASAQHPRCFAVPITKQANPQAGFAEWMAKHGKGYANDATVRTQLAARGCAAACVRPQAPPVPSSC